MFIINDNYKLTTLYSLFSYICSLSLKSLFASKTLKACLGAWPISEEAQASLVPPSHCALHKIILSGPQFFLYITYLFVLVYLK